MKRVIRSTLLVLLVVTAVLSHDGSTYRMMAQAGEPRFSYPAASRFGLTSYFDHHAPTYAVDDNITIYTNSFRLFVKASKSLDQMSNSCLWHKYRLHLVPQTDQG